MRLSLGKLRAAAEARGITVPSRAPRREVANLLIIHKLREVTESDYRETGVGFAPKDAAYPHLSRLVAKYELRRILDLGCGAGVFAGELTRVLPPDGSYFGIDVAPTAIALALQRFADDARFQFAVGDAGELAGLPERAVDGVAIAFVLTYLDTAAADRLLRDVARLYADAVVIIALTFRACIDPHDADAPPDDKRELRLARDYLAGDRAPARKLWDTTRWDYYVKSIERHFEVAEERVLAATAQKFWVLRGKQTRKRNRGRA